MAPSKTESGALAPYAQKPNGLLLRSDPLPKTKGQLINQVEMKQTFFVHC